MDATGVDDSGGSGDQGTRSDGASDRSGSGDGASEDGAMSQTKTKTTKTQTCFKSILMMSKGFYVKELVFILNSMKYGFLLTVASYFI